MRRRKFVSPGIVSYPELAPNLAAPRLDTRRQGRTNSTDLFLTVTLKGPIRPYYVRVEECADTKHPRSPYQGSLHDCWWYGLFSPTILFRPAPCADANAGGSNFRVARHPGLDRQPQQHG